MSDDILDTGKDIKRRSDYRRYKIKQHAKETSPSRSKNINNVKKNKNKGGVKICPACREEMGRRTSNGTCRNCGVKLYLHDGEYFLVEQPVERLIIYNWSKFVERYAGVDLDDVENIKTLMPSSDDIGIVFLKNEAWAGNRLLKLCNKDFILALNVIDIYHEEMPRSNLNKLSLYYIVNYPGLLILIQRAKKRKAQEKIKRAEQIISVESVNKRIEKYGDIFNKQDNAYEHNDDDN